MTARLVIDAVDGDARATTITTARGTFRTPCFMPVGTRGAVKTLSAVDLDALGADVMLANTYHLMLRPGVEVIAAVGGLHRFAGWGGHMLTDSGGFQVFSLSPAVDDDGVTFRSTYDGSAHRLTPETAVAAQRALGADIQMALDVCPPLPAPRHVVQLAVDRTAAWAARAKVEHERTASPSDAASPGAAGGGAQALFGIVQGGVDSSLRVESARRTVDVGFAGYGIGGLSVGESRAEMLAALGATLAELPTDAPRYLMGVGDPLGLVCAVGLGVDMFDCVLPTRLGRHGTALTSRGRMSVRGAISARDDGPVDPACPCPTCQVHSRAYLRHLFQVGEPTAARLLTLHNLAWILALVRGARQAIATNRFGRFSGDVAAVWGETAPPEG
ncbi:MAG: tRNA guanosine(34) transglycosylase Tgt [Actinobacteria bacterium]|nr:tRNA guanosine(34) transglycosylase Tgt [Actinomycetota bacterium]